MTTLVWDQIGTRTYETGVDRGVLYTPNSIGQYINGYAWNGLTSVSESPSGAEPSAMYADNIKYLNLFSIEEFGATVECYTYPDEWLAYDGLVVPQPGIAIGQQARKTFGLSYRTKIGNDVVGDDAGYKLHLIYGATSSPSEKAYNTINESPDIITFSYELTTVAVPVAGLRPTSVITVDSTVVDPEDLAALEALLYGTAGTDPMLPLPDAVVSMFSGDQTLVTPSQPSFDGTTNTITIPTITGVTYSINGVPVEGNVVITEDVIVVASPQPGYVFPAVTDDDWFYDYVPV